jgi:hypothetical protein
MGVADLPLARDFPLLSLKRLKGLRNLASKQVDLVGSVCKRILAQLV